MPFPDQPRRPFTRTEIDRYPPDVRGCYGLFDDAGCIYIGKGRIRDRLRAHCEGAGITEEERCIREQAPTYWLVEESDDFIVRHLGLVVEYRPRCNR
ncbi:MAG: hypothetical protein ACYTEZ_09285 [Planctomycetota bacterium]